MKALASVLLIGSALLIQTGCDDVLEDLNLDIGFYGSPGYSWSDPGGYYGDSYVEEFGYEESYYEDSWYAVDWSFWPW